jgi:YjbE family integral membrane protein
MPANVLTWTHLPDWGTIAQILFVNLALSGDNALVIALAAHQLPPIQRRMAILAGGSLAVVLQTLFTLLASSLLRIPGLLLAGGLLLFYVALKLIAHEAAQESPRIRSRTVLAAICIIVYADLAMSLDNVLAVAGLGRGNLRPMVVGLLISATLTLLCSSLIANLMHRFPWLVYGGAAMISLTASEMVLPSAQPGWHALITAACLAIGLLWKHIQDRPATSSVDSTIA